MKTCTVCFRDASGQPIGAHVTQASTLFEACQNALDWFNDPHWQGPRPHADTILEVQVVGDSRKHRVRSRRYTQAAKAGAEQSRLFESAAPAAFDPKR